MLGNFTVLAQDEPVLDPSEIFTEMIEVVTTLPDKSSDGRSTSAREVCGRMIDSLDRWILYHNPEDNLLYFCFSATGELTQALPEELQEALCEQPFDYQFLYRTSPNADWVIFANCPLVSDAVYSQGYAIYSYEIATAETTHLGNTEVVGTLIFADWVDEYSIVIKGSTLGNQHYRYIYIADIRETNGLELIASQFVSYPLYFDNPTRYIWVKDSYEVWEYNIRNRQENLIASVGCEFFVATCNAIPNNTLNDNDGQPSLVAILNHVLQSDDPASFKIYDVVTGEMIYATNFKGDFGWTEQQSAFTWLTTSSFLLIETENNTGSTSYSGRIVDLEAIPATHTVIKNLYSSSFSSYLSPDRNYLLIQNRDAEITPSLYDIHGHQVIPIFETGVKESYGVSIAWHEGDLLEISISQDESGDILGRWLVRALPTR